MRAVIELLDHHLELPFSGAIDAKTLPSHGGVYLMTDDRQQPILLAFGENLRRVVLNRLSMPPPNEKTKRANLAEIARHLWWRETFSTFETACVHWQAARVLYPKSYRDLIGFGSAWFLRVDPQADVPRFTVVKEFREDRAEYLGPFGTRAQAEDWIHMLEDAFDLCRYYHILEQAPRGEACAYFEMGKCPAPCDGTISMTVYREMIAEALDFSLGVCEPRLANLRSAMTSAATELNFEKAASIRRTIERIETLIKKPEYQYVDHLSRFSWLILQRGGPPRRASKKILVKPFHVRHGLVETGEPVPLTEIENATVRWLNPQPQNFKAAPPSDYIKGRSASSLLNEGIWLVSKFLFLKDKNPGLFFRLDRPPSSEELVKAINDRFGPRHMSKRSS